MLSNSIEKILIGIFQSKIIDSAEKIKRDFCNQFEEDLNLSTEEGKLKVIKESLTHYRSEIKKIEKQDPFKENYPFIELALKSILTTIANSQINKVTSYPIQELFEILEQFLAILNKQLNSFSDELKKINELIGSQNKKLTASKLAEITTALTDLKVYIEKGCKTIHSLYYDNRIEDVMIDDFECYDETERIETLLKDLPNVINELILKVNKNESSNLLSINIKNVVSDLKSYSTELKEIFDKAEEIRNEKLHDFIFNKEQEIFLANALGKHRILQYIESKNTRHTNKANPIKPKKIKSNTFNLTHSRKLQILEILYKAVAEGNTPLIAECSFNKFELAFSNSFIKEPLRIKWVGSRRALAFFIYKLRDKFIPSNTHYNSIIENHELFVDGSDQKITNIKTEFGEVSEGIVPTKIDNLLRVGRFYLFRFFVPVFFKYRIANRD